LLERLLEAKNTNFTHPMSFFSQRMTILGPGLLGGSLAGAVRRHGLAQEIRVWGRRAEVLSLVKKRGWADEVTTDVREACAQADFIILATPVGVMPELATQIVASSLRDDVIITDVGSVKGWVAENVAPIFQKKGLTFVGSHPMAGAEVSGFEAARDDLFEDAACVLTPHAHATERVRSFWTELGCRVSVMTAAEHDQAVARISHLPHITAALTVLAALHPRLDIARLAGGGFRDTTRIAEGDVAMWTEILLENRAALIAPLQHAQSQLADFIEALEKQDTATINAWLAQAREKRLAAQMLRTTPTSTQFFKKTT
jgi:prephenate dehydrogenase